MHLEILLEEASMEIVVNSILARLTADIEAQHTWQTHPHQGKAQLLKQLPAKLRAYSHWLPKVYAEYHVIVILDQDGSNCQELKQKIAEYAKQAGIFSETTIRIVVTELESWFLGDCAALESAFPRLKRLNLGGIARYRDPDERQSPSEDLDRELKNVDYSGYSKLIDSQKICAYLNLSDGYNGSTSFQVTLARLKKLIELHSE